MTPSASALLEMLREESRVFDDITTSDGSTIARQRAEARRDTLDSLIQRLPRILSAVEAEAMEEYRGVKVLATPTYRHASGDDHDGCIACWDDGHAEYDCCKTPTAPDIEGRCGLCGHTVEVLPDT